jgi:hypothetical protein
MSPLELQRIVDGEFDHAERARMLGSLGDDVREWRSLALALLEEQQWSRESQRDSFVSDIGVALNSSERTRPSSPQTPDASTVQVRNPSAGKSSQGLPWFTALAASVMLCIGLAGGVLLSSNHESKLDTRMAIQDLPSRLERESKLPMKMVLTGTGGTEARPLEIPVVDASEIDPKNLWDRNAKELAMLKQKLKREGYRLEWKPQWYSGRLNDGSQVVVPFHNVALKSVGL